MDADRLWLLFVAALLTLVLALLKHRNDELQAKLPREFERGRQKGREETNELHRRAGGALRERIAAHQGAVEVGEQYVRERLGRNGQ